MFSFESAARPRNRIMPGRAFSSLGRAGPECFCRVTGRAGPNFFRAGLDFFFPCRALIFTTATNIEDIDGMMSRHRLTPYNATISTDIDNLMVKGIFKRPQK